MDRRLLEIDLRTSLRTLSDLAFPRLCLVCGRILLPWEDDLCICCRADFPRTYFERVPRNPMADAFNSKVADSRYCYATALFYYTGNSGYRKITQALKYGRNFGAGRRFARELAANLPQWMQDVDAVVPVPLHWTRRFRRGYNQAEIIAREVSRGLRGSSCICLLTRARRTRSQAHTGVSGKAGNVKDAFRVNMDHTDRELHHILLIDDVFTTGATLAACHSALRKAYGNDIRISVATLAFVGNI